MTFRDPEAARRACADPTPIIDGRRANCNLASLGRPRPPMQYAVIPNIPGQSCYSIHIFLFFPSLYETLKFGEVFNFSMVHYRLNLYIIASLFARPDKTCFSICWKCAESSRFTFWKLSVSATTCL